MCAAAVYVCVCVHPLILPASGYISWVTWSNIFNHFLETQSIKILLEEQVFTGYRVSHTQIFLSHSFFDSNCIQIWAKQCASDTLSSNRSIRSNSSRRRRLLKKPQRQMPAKVFKVGPHGGYELFVNTHTDTGIERAHMFVFTTPLERLSTCRQNPFDTQNE